MQSLSLRRFLFGTTLSGNKLFHTAWLLFRIYLGLSLALGAGWPKIQDGFAPEWFEKQVYELGFRIPSAQFWSTLAAWGEFIGGLCLALGLLTRLMALQLAFQFFVIAFVWYDAPAPIVGMYYQQLFFWCYVLILVGGGGRFSADQLLSRWTARATSRSLLLAPLALLAAVLVLAAISRNRPARPHTVVFRVQAPGPVPGQLGLRGMDAPLNWQRDLVLRRDTAAGDYRATVTFHTPWSSSSVKFVRDGVFELEGQENRKVTFAPGDTTQYAATYNQP